MIRFNRIIKWCDDNFGLFLFILGSLVIVGLLTFFFFLFQSINESQNKYKEDVQRQYEVCLTKGGELLERTYRVGKYSRSEFVCLDKKVILN